MNRTNEEKPNSQIIKTKDAFASDDNFDPEEALEANVDERKFLMKRLFGDTRVLINTKSGLNGPHKNIVT